MSEQKQEAVTIDASGIKGYECKFSVLCYPPDGYRDDLHLVKTTIHKQDGTTEPAVQLIKNFKRNFWTTKKAYQNYQQPKEWLEIDKLDIWETTQSQLTDSIKRALGLQYLRGDPREVLKSPYLFGADILSTAIVKKTYQDKYPDCQSFYTVAAFDTEKDVVYGTDEINMATLSFGSRVFTAVQKSFLEGVGDVQNRAKEAFQKYLSNIEAKDKDGNPIVRNVITERKIDWELLVVDDEISIIRECFKRAHEWKPDFLAIWNIDFDMSIMLKACEKAGVDPKDIFCDPAVPFAYRFFKYKQGPSQKKTASGKITPIKPADRWHTVYCPSSFYFVDAMCVYRKLRVAKGEEQSYALDAILDKILGTRKLKFKEAEQYTKLEWHQHMQQYFKIEYIIYNVFDCVSMEMLDEVTLDLAVAMPGGSATSDFANFKSQPRRVVDQLHWFALENGKVMGCSSDALDDGLNDLTFSLTDWITTLPAHLTVDSGLQCIEENPNTRSRIWTHTWDLDVSASSFSI